MALDTELPDQVGEAEARFLGRVVFDLVVSMHHGGGDLRTGHVAGCTGEKTQIGVRQVVRRTIGNYGRDYHALPCKNSIALRRWRR